MTKCNLKVLVTRIIMEGDKAVGVELKQGKKVELMRKAIVLNLMLMIGPKILILYTTLGDTYGHPTEHEFKPAAKIKERCVYFVSIFAL